MYLFTGVYAAIFRYLEGLSHNQAARVIADAFRDRKTGHVDFLVTSTHSQSGLI